MLVLYLPFTIRVSINCAWIQSTSGPPINISLILKRFNQLQVVSHNANHPWLFLLSISSHDNPARLSHEHRPQLSTPRLVTMVWHLVNIRPTGTQPPRSRRVPNITALVVRTRTRLVNTGVNPPIFRTHQLQPLLYKPQQLGKLRYPEEWVSKPRPPCLKHLQSSLISLPLPCLRSYLTARSIKVV